MMNFYVKLEKNDFKYSIERIKALKEIIDRLSKLVPDNEFIKVVDKEYNDLVK